MAPALAAYARTLLTSALDTRAPEDTNSLGPRHAHNLLLARDGTSTNRPDPESGILHPSDINNKFMFVLFGLIGAGFVALGIWFFFWARNGGFFFQQNDWDDYKTTVLRRKGPNGTTLSGATTATDLGGGSVYKDIDDDGRTELTGTETTLTGITAGASDLAGREKRRQKRVQKEREKERRREEKRRDRDEKKKQRSRDHSSRKVGHDGAVVDEDAEAEAAKHLRNYRHERPARVGGINRESDASTWDGSTNPTNSSRGGHSESGVTDELISSRERDPAATPAKKTGGIRKVYSTADKRDTREAERIKAEARKLQEKGRAATASSSGGSGAGGHRRNFSWQRDNTVSEDAPMMAMASPPPTYTASEVETRVPGSWTESDVGTSEVGTKVYQHYIPGLSSAGSSSGGGGTDVRDYADERRKNRRSGGYRRDR